MQWCSSQRVHGHPGSVVQQPRDHVVMATAGGEVQRSGTVKVSFINILPLSGYLHVAQEIKALGATVETYIKAFHCMV